MKKLFLIYLIVLSLSSAIYSQNEVQIARLKYSGGGDWYNDPSGEVNLLKYVQSVTGIKTKPEYVFVDINSDKIFNYPILFMTGHGNITFTESEAKRLRKYLENGGFLYADDDYGMDKAFRREMKKVFPDQELQEVPFTHPIYHSFFQFDKGLPKVHEHDKKPPQGFGYFLNDRLVVFYTYESNLGDGWVESDVYKDPPEIRELAFRMGTNIVVYALTH
ncbi:MAG: DUF4159 domain-containing protein [Ignavibacteria bacterium]